MDALDLDVGADADGDVDMDDQGHAPVVVHEHRCAVPACRDVNAKTVGFATEEELGEHLLLCHPTSKAAKKYRV